MPRRITTTKARKPRTYIKRSARRTLGRLSRRRVNKSKNGTMPQKHYATITETITFPDINSNQTTYETFSLKDFTRALSIAPNYKFYRAKKVLYKYEPIFNLFTEGAAPGNETIPLAFMVMNRTQERFNYTPAQLQQQGAIPRKFTGTINMKYTPNWCSQGLGAYTQVPGGPITSINAQGLTKQYGWLASPAVNGQLDVTNVLINGTLQAINVNPMSVYSTNTIYNGHIVHFQQQQVGPVAEVCRRTVTVVWEFKGPKTYAINANEPGQLPAVGPSDPEINNNLNLNMANLTIQS